MPPKPTKPPSADDVVLVHGRTDDGAGLRVLRKRADLLSAGELRPVEEGKPLRGELVSLRPREGAPQLFDVDVLLGAPERPEGGPAQVASPAYRAGWSSIFGRRPRATGAPN